jgi:hypothetical protein
LPHGFIAIGKALQEFGLDRAQRINPRIAMGQPLSQLGSTAVEIVLTGDP